MLKTFLLSMALHILLIAFLLLIGAHSPPAEAIIETMNIRIQAVSGRIEGTQRATGGLPSETMRDRPFSPQLPVAGGGAGKQDSWKVGNTPSVQANPYGSRIDVPPPPSPPSAENVLDAGIGSRIDPLSGMEEFLAKSGAADNTDSDPWAVSWVNGGNRGILSYPELDPNAIPDETDRLLNLRVQITVSPQGEVIAAEIEEPGSGDIRIDRYMHGLALSFVFDPRPNDEDNLNGTLRLVFLGGG